MMYATVGSFDHKYVALFLIGFGILGMIWCIAGLFWIRNLSRKYKKQIDIPWGQTIEKFKNKQISFNELMEQTSLFGQLANASSFEYRQWSPIYFIKHWNDKYNREWLEGRKT